MCLIHTGNRNLKKIIVFDSKIKYYLFCTTKYSWTETNNVQSVMVGLLVYSNKEVC